MPQEPRSGIGLITLVYLQQKDVVHFNMGPKSTFLRKVQKRMPLKDDSKVAIFGVSTGKITL